MHFKFRSVLDTIPGDHLPRLAYVMPIKRLVREALLDSFYSLNYVKVDGEYKRLVTVDVIPTGHAYRLGFADGTSAIVNAGTWVTVG